MDDGAALGATTLMTDRLRLRPRRASDAAVQRRLWGERDPRVPPHRRIDADGRPTVRELEERMLTGGDGHPLGLLAIEVAATDEVIGYCGLVDALHGASDEPELAFELLREHWGRGYATEAGRAVVDWASTAGYRRLQATVREWNTASRRVLAKLGFVETGRVEPDAIHGAVLHFDRGRGA
jgi:RimJ/RimL family protein N-acetyltransferase